jgi:hypothetical protein
MMKAKRVIKQLSRYLLVLTLLASICLALASESAAKELPLEVSASVDRDKVTIGDRITYTITVRADRDIEVKFPEFGENLGGFAIKDFGTSQKRWWPKKTYRQWYVLDTYVSGEYTIPEAVINYRHKGDQDWRQISTKEVSIRVESILQSAEDSSDIRDIADPVSFPVKIPWYVWTIALIIAGAGTIPFLLKRKKNEEILAYRRPAHEIAYEALEALKKKEYLKHGQTKNYYIELSDIVRRYLENRFNLHAPEMTTEEFLNAVRQDKALSYEHKSLLRDFLSHCDLVKFAKYQPPQEEANLSFESAKRLVDQTKQEVEQETKV